MAFQLQGFDPGAILARQELPPDPQVMQANALKLQAAQQEQSLFPIKQQMAQEDLKTAQYTNREKQLDLQETGVWQQTMQKYGGDFDKARPELAAQLRPKTLAAVDNIYLNHQDKLADIGKKKADAAKISNELSNDERETFGGIAADVQKSNYNPTAMDASLTMLERTHPEYKQHIDALRQQFQQDPDSIKKLVDGMVTPKAAEAAQKVQASKAQTDEAQQKVLTEKLNNAARTAPDNAAEWPGWYAGLDPDVKRRVPAAYSQAAADKVRRMGLSAAEAETARHNLETEDTARTNAENQATEARLAKVATDPERPQEERDAANAALKRLDQSKMASRSVNNFYPGAPTTPPTGAAAQVHGDDYLKTLPPPFAARVKAITAGNEPAPTGRAAMSGPGLQLMNAVYQFDPEYTPLLAQQRKETLKEFTSTQTSHAGGQLLALNTLVHHADLYLEVAQALKNGNWRPGNDLYNRVASAFGSAPPTEANLVARFLAGETGKVATGGVPAEGEINGILGNLRNDGSPDQMQKAGQRILQIAAGRMVPLKERRDQAKLQNFVQILGPDAQSILQKRGFDPETMRPAQAGGRGQQGGGARGSQGSGHVIDIGGKQYQYNGTGATDDMSSYTEVKSGGR